MNKEPTCLIWGTPAIETYSVPNVTAAICDSPRAGGKFWISYQAQHLIADPKIDWTDERLKARLTSWLIEQREAGEDCPKVYGRELNGFTIRPSLPIKKRARNLLTYISRSVTDVADNFVFTRNDHQTRKMLAWSESVSQGQLTNVFQFLLDIEHLEMVSRDTFRLAATGHEQIAKGNDNMGLDDLPTEAHMLIGEMDGKTEFLQRTLGEIIQGVLTEEQRNVLFLALKQIEKDLAKRYPYPEKVAYQTGFVRGVFGAHNLLRDPSSPPPSA